METLESRYKTINKWVRRSEPEKIKVKNRPPGEKQKTSDAQFEEMIVIITPFIPHIVEILKDSVIYYNARPDKKSELKKEGAAKQTINLDVIVDEIRAKDSKIKDKDFWSSFLIKNDFSLEILIDQSKPEEITAALNSVN